VEIGDDCVVAHGVMFINDKFGSGSPARGDRSLWMKTSIGNRVYIGSGATILPIAICDDVVIGAGAVVTRDIDKPGSYAGNPARLLKHRSVENTPQ
jgi:acetyltransferase-like isoleucine patch superfamily enzyme